MAKLIIGLVGLPGSGKGTAAKILQEKYNAKLYRFSSILGDVLDRVAVEKSRDNFIKISEALRSAFGEDVLAFAIERDAATSESDVVVIDGIRRLQDIVALEPLPQFNLIEVAAPPEVRYERMKGRGEKGGESTMTWEKFLEEENASTEVTIPSVAARADHVIQNGGTQEELEQQIEELMNEFKTK